MMTYITEMPMLTQRHRNNWEKQIRLLKGNQLPFFVVWSWEGPVPNEGVLWPTDQSKLSSRIFDHAQRSFESKLHFRWSNWIQRKKISNSVQLPAH